MIENDGKKLYWDWEHRMRTNCIVRKADLILEDAVKKMILLIDMESMSQIRKPNGRKRSESTNSYAANLRMMK